MKTSNDIPLGSAPVNRAAHYRTDKAWLETALKRDDALIFLIHDGMPLMAPDGQGLVWLGPEAMRLSPDMTIFLGLDKLGAPIFVADLEIDFQLEGSLLQGAGAFMDMRPAAAAMPEMEANLASTARSLLEWHRAHGYCSRCGAVSETAEAGWKRVCPACGAEHFPRTDPVAIMLATHDDRCLLGRQKSWPEGMWSALAGFVEPGETVEQAAARELEEESGIKANPEDAEYLFCQPWPFPSSLMVGIIIPAQTTDISVEQDELEAARWITRDEARQVLAGAHPDIKAPHRLAVAHHILKEWAERED